MAPKQTEKSPQAGKSAEWDEYINSDAFMEKIKAIVRTELKSEMDNRIEEVTKMITEVREEVESLKVLQSSNVSAINIKLDDIEFDLKSVANVRQQRERDEGVMIYDLPLPPSTGYNTVAQTNYIFDTLLRPMCEKAKKDGLIRYIPEPLEMVKVCHPVPRKAKVTTGTEQGPQTHQVDPIILKFASKNWKAMVYKYKREVLEAWNTRHSHPGRKVQVEILDDLTKTNISCLNWLKSEDNANIIESANYRGGKIKYRLKTNPRTLKVVTDPFTRNIQDISVKKCGLL